MTTATIKKVIKLPGGTAPAQSKVTAVLKLVATSDETEGWGYVTGSDYDVCGEYPGTYTVTGGVGTVVWTGVSPNTGSSEDVIRSPSNTAYAVEIRIDGVGAQNVEYIRVQDTATAQWVQNILTTEPSDVGAVTSASSTTVDDDDLPLPVANMQEGIESVSPAVAGATLMRQPPLNDWYDTLEACRYSSSAQAKCLVIGDSISSIISYRPWVHRVALDFAHLFNQRGGQYDGGWKVAKDTTGTTARALDSCQGTQTETGLGGFSSLMTNGQTAQDVGYADGYIIAYTADPSYGSIQVRVDGVLVQTITCTGTAASTQLASISGVSYASHTLLLTAVGTVKLEGVLICQGNRTGGFQMWNASHSGYDCSDFTGTASLGLAGVTSIDPDIVVIALGTNDSVSTFQADLTALVVAVQALTSSPILIVGPYLSDSGAANLVTKNASAHAVARAKGCGYLSMATLVGFLGTNGIGGEDSSDWLAADGVHPSMPGEQMLADCIGAALSGDPLGYALTAWRRGPRMHNGMLHYEASGSGRFGMIDAGTASGLAAGMYDDAAHDYPSVAFLNAALATALGLGSGAATVFGASGALPSEYLGYLSAGILKTASQITMKALSLTGATGAVAGGRFMGFVASGAPASGTFALNDLIFDVAGGCFRYCTTAGTPGTWTKVAAAWSINPQTGTTYTLATTDRFSVVGCTNAAGCTVTVPHSSTADVEVGSLIAVVGTAGPVTIAAAGSVIVGGSGTFSAGSLVLLFKVLTNSWWVLGTPPASTSVVGSVELATDAETLAGSDTTRALTPSNLEARFMARGRPKATNNHLVLPGCMPSGQSTLALTANRRYFVPIYFDHPTTLDALVCEVTTGVASALLRIGLAVANEDYQPTSVLADSGNLDGSAAAVLTFATAQTALLGRHVLMWHSDSAITLRCVRAPMVGGAFAPTLGAAAILSTMYKATAYAAFDTTNWDTNGYLTQGPDHAVFCRVTDPTP